MKRLTLIGLLIGAVSLGIILGGYVGARLAGLAYGRLAYSKPEVEMAANAAQVAEWLAELRLGESTNVIDEMENNLSIQMQTLATWDYVVPLDDHTRQARDRWLVPVKVYRLSYPASGADVARANDLLNTIPGRSPKITCRSGVCRLDDLRLAKLAGSTNAP